MPSVPSPTRPATALLAEPPPAPTAVRGPFQRTARPVRPLTRPVAVVRRGPPLWRVHECVFAVLALESEPVDPRL